MGILLDNKLNMNPEVDARIRKAKAAATTFADTVKTIPPSMLAARVRITGACAVILPHLLYLWREIPFTPQQRSTMTDVATQLLAKVLGNTSGVSARTILQHVENITKGLTPRMKQMAEIPWELQKDTYADLSIAQTSDFHKQGQSTSILHVTTEMNGAPQPATRKPFIPKLKLTEEPDTTDFVSPREDLDYEETRDVYATTLECSPPTPGFGQDKHPPNTSNMTLRLETIRAVELAQLTCPYCGMEKTTKQATRAHFTTAHPGLYRPPPDDPCYCTGCKRVMTKPYYRDHRCRKAPTEEFKTTECVGCGKCYANPQLSAHLIHCVKYTGQLIPSRQNTGAFEFAKKIRELLKPMPVKRLDTVNSTCTNQTLKRAKDSLRPHTPREKRCQASANPHQITPRRDAELMRDRADRMRKDTEEAIRREQSYCKLCHKELKSSQALRRHESLYHPERTRPKGLPVACIGCNIAFKTAATYVKHKCKGTPRGELAEKACPECGEVTLANPEYSVHLLEHHPGIYS
ncbi:hypothetical protein GNI_188450 [Gregarina niphandrodes]|uniref:C2H2-type domain-containing protein n=1 Tax=Gregarina niphandrodes TaxID=110365 RepID=A0A023AWY7_GRENI|nr:hypothetical protein GNI_188450 [Gregarina niphandrodes]EZG43097.1 hypothetical protein GNI_188450 [Gregarina niphandrodes]|eukprot:XP_011134671.1 hypothetical protein GNI_188450 [Gregarina niphandrodes]